MQIGGLKKYSCPYYATELICSHPPAASFIFSLPSERLIGGQTPKGFHFLRIIGSAIWVQEFMKPRLVVIDCVADTRARPVFPVGWRPDNEPGPTTTFLDNSPQTSRTSRY